MFQSNCIFIDKNDLEKLFQMGKPQKNGEMTLEEFIQFASNQHANQKFRSKLSQVKSEPTLFSLKQQTQTQQQLERQQTQTNIQKQEVNKKIEIQWEKWQNDLSKFERLFSLNKNLDNKLNSDNYIYRQIKMAKYYEKNNSKNINTKLKQKQEMGRDQDFERHNENIDEVNSEYFQENLISKTSTKNAHTPRDIGFIHEITKNMHKRVQQNNTLATIQEQSTFINTQQNTMNFQNTLTTLNSQTQTPFKIEFLDKEILDNQLNKEEPEIYVFSDAGKIQIQDNNKLMTKKKLQIQIPESQNAQYVDNINNFFEIDFKDKIEVQKHHNSTRNKVSTNILTSPIKQSQLYTIKQQNLFKQSQIHKQNYDLKDPSSLLEKKQVNVKNYLKNYTQSKKTQNLVQNNEQMLSRKVPVSYNNDQI
eukprot:403362466